MIFEDGLAPDRLLQIYRTTYEDVQRHARHLDEQMRSLVTALAFLTAAGVSLFVVGAAGVLPDLHLDGRSWNAGNVFFLAFLCSAALSLSSALVAIDPTSHRPHFLGGEKPNKDSILFHEGVSRHPWWINRTITADVADNATRALVLSYRTDGVEIATRTGHKVQRAQHAHAYMNVAITSLVAMGIARLPESKTETRTTLLILSLVAFVALPYGTYWLMRQTDFPAVGPSYARAARWRVGAFYALPLAVASTLGLLTLWFDRPAWPTVFYCLAWILSSRIAIFAQHAAPYAGVLAGLVGAGLIAALVISPNDFRGGLLTLRAMDSVIREGATLKYGVCLDVDGPSNGRLLVTAWPSDRVTASRLRVINPVPGRTRSAEALLLDHRLLHKPLDLGAQGRANLLVPIPVEGRWTVAVRPVDRTTYTRIAVAVPSAEQTPLQQATTCGAL